MKAQTAMEFVMLVGGVILFVALVVILVRGGVFAGAEANIDNQSQIIASLKAGLNATVSP